MDLSSLQLLDIAAGTVIGMMLGALWYSPVAFGNAWMVALGKTTESLGSQTGPMIGSMIASLLTAVGVALVSAAFMPSTAGEALAVGLMLGGFIIFPAMLSDNLFCGWGNKLLLIQVGYRVASVVLMSLVMYFLQY